MECDQLAALRGHQVSFSEKKEDWKWSMIAQKPVSDLWSGSMRKIAIYGSTLFMNLIYGQ